ncbi:ribonucleotide-diphosphate reductase subunit alpha [Pseudorhodobacter turbinis]|uniref:Ribonucleotide-diphosphate reductase subunit alpha n=2 Tax=Pseudorhodobacter turbinis TaxID=2500533 RepID=A0A4P8EH24_9RHOB|nr:ribonucleotide-diphosphate reductase subunit alpha [Pseudorhodobacter turbinis]
MRNSKMKSSTPLSRRGFMSAVSAMSMLSLSQWPGQAFGQGVGVDAFLALSEKLIGQDSLPQDIAGGMLSAFNATGKMDNISTLSADTVDSDLANAIVAAWYTGESPDPDDLTVLAYDEALIWQAMDFTKPMGFCGGGVGYWADPPEA